MQPGQHRTSVFGENSIKSQDYPPINPRFPEKCQDLFKSDILASSRVVFLASIDDSKETLTFSNKYSVFNVNYLISIHGFGCIYDKSLLFCKWNKPRSQNLMKTPQDLGGNPSVGDSAQDIVLTEWIELLVVGSVSGKV